MVGFNPDVPDFLKPDPVPHPVTHGKKKSGKRSRRKSGKKKSSASYDADWSPEHGEQVSFIDIGLDYIVFRKKHPLTFPFICP